MSFVYEQKTKLNLSHVHKKTDNDYRQCIKTNRSLFARETLKCEKSAFAAEKVVVVASGSVRTADEQNMKSCNNDHVMGIKHPSNNKSRIPKLSKPVKNATVKERMETSLQIRSVASPKQTKTVLMHGNVLLYQGRTVEIICNCYQ